MVWFVEKHKDSGLIVKIKSYKSYQSNCQKIEVINTNCYGKMLILDGLIQTTEKDEFIYHEMLAHVPLITHPEPKNLLIIGGGDGGIVREASKYENIQITLVEIDKKVIEVALTEFPGISKALHSINVKIINEDGSFFIKNKKEEYDVIIVDSSDPISHSKSLFKEEFYFNVKKALKKDGIFAFQSESPFLYLNFMKKTKKCLLKYFKIMKYYFAVIPTYPGSLWSFAIASDVYEPKLDDKKLKKIKSLETKYFNEEIYQACFAVPNFIKNKLK